MKTAIITGVSGQDGAYLSELLIANGYKVIGLVRSSKSSLDGLKYLDLDSQVTIEECDLLDITNIMMLFQKYNPDEVYNLAAQSSVAKSFAQPLGSIEFNLISVLNLLEAIKSVDSNIKFYQASSSEMYGIAKELPIHEDMSFHPRSPYGVSKAAAHWTTVHYREAFGIFACCGILFNHESYLRRDTFFIKKLIRECLEISRGNKDKLRLGNIDVYRDFGYSPDYVKAMWMMLQADDPDDYIICSGKSISLRSIVEYVFRKLEIHDRCLVIDPELYRPTDIENIYGNNEKARNKLDWDCQTDFFDVLDKLIEEERRSSN